MVILGIMIAPPLLVTLVPKPPSSNSHKSKLSPQVPQSQGASYNADGKACGNLTLLTGTNNLSVLPPKPHVREGVGWTQARGDSIVMCLLP